MTEITSGIFDVPRSENILQIHNEDGYNLLQRVVGLNNLEMIRWCLTRNIDINRYGRQPNFFFSCLFLEKISTIVSLAIPCKLK